MKNLKISILLIVIVCACKKENRQSIAPHEDRFNIAKKIKKSLNQDDALSINSLTSKKKINCDSVWKKWSFLQSKKDSIVDYILSKFKDSLPKENIKLLTNLRVRKDSLLKFKQPLSSVFKGLEKEPFLISNSQWKKNGEGYQIYFPEDYIFKTVDTVQADYTHFESRKYFRKILNKFPKNVREIKIIGLKNTKKALVTVLGKQNSECEPYAFYNLEYLDQDYFFNPLIASPYQIEIEFGSWPKVDLLIKHNPINFCSDCPNSYNKEKTFAKLKGTTNVFFSFQGPKLKTKESYTPSRSLFYVDENFEIIQLWSDSIDLFGCSCL